MLRSHRRARSPLIRIQRYVNSLLTQLLPQKRASGSLASIFEEARVEVAECQKGGSSASDLVCMTLLSEVLVVTLPILCSMDKCKDNKDGNRDCTLVYSRFSYTLEATQQVTKKDNTTASSNL